MEPCTIKHAVCIIAILFVNTVTYATEYTDSTAKLIKKSSRRSAMLEQQVTKKTRRYLSTMQKIEARLYRQLSKVDSTAAKNLFAGNPDAKYAAIADKLNADTAAQAQTFSGTYYPYTDSLHNVLAFLDKTKGADKSLEKLDLLQYKFQSADEAQRFIQQRKTLIKEYLSQYSDLPKGLKDTYTKYNSELYYYSAQLKSCKETLEDPDKLLKATLASLHKVPAFNNFMQQNSVLSQLFGSTASAGNMTTPAGLATRDQLAAVMQGQVSAGGPGAGAVMSGNMQSARAQLDRLQKKALSSGGDNNGADLPDNFKVNYQKGKSFFQRIDFGCNIQNSPSSYVIPAMSVIGLSAEYKVRDGITAGIGLAYHIGLGKGIEHVRFSSEGIGLRSNVNVELKKIIWISAGFEENYMQQFSSIREVQRYHLWQKSALTGVTKKLRIGKKENNIQLLYDVLASQQRPRGQALKFRVGYKL